MEMINGNTILMSLVFLAAFCLLGYFTQEVEEEVEEDVKENGSGYGKYCWGQEVTVMCSNKEMGKHLSDYWSKKRVSNLLLIDLGDILSELNYDRYSNLINEKTSKIKSSEKYVIFYGGIGNDCVGDCLYVLRTLGIYGYKCSYVINPYNTESMKIAYMSLIRDDSEFEGYDIVF